MTLRRYVVSDSQRRDVSVDGNNTTIQDLVGTVKIGSSDGGDVVFSKVDMDYFIRNDSFPSKQSLYRNEEMDNTLDVSAGTEIEVSSVDTTAGTITLTWVPYVSSIFAPVAGKEWALVNLENMNSGTDPSLVGDYTTILKITSGVYSTGVLVYEVAAGIIGDWTAGDTVMLFNPLVSNIVWDENNPHFKNGDGIYNLYANPGGGFYHSDGSYIILVNGSTAPNVGGIGAYKSSGNDWKTWTKMSSGAAIFSPTGSGWMKGKIANGGHVIKLPNEDRYIAYLSGYNATTGKWAIGWVKFDEDFTAASIEYASAEIIDSSGSADGLELGDVIYYGGKYRMVYIDRVDGDPTSTAWVWKEAFCDTPDGTFASSVTIQTTKTSDDGTYWSSHIDGAAFMPWKGRLYCWIAGTSRYSSSGTRANRVFGLWYLDEISGDTLDWVEDVRNPILINPFYANHIWTGYDWASDHLGRQISLAMHPTNGRLYIFLNAGRGTDTYQGGIATINVEDLLLH